MRMSSIWKPGDVVVIRTDIRNVYTDCLNFELKGRLNNGDVCIVLEKRIIAYLIFCVATCTLGVITSHQKDIVL